MVSIDLPNIWAEKNPENKNPGGKNPDIEAKYVCKSQTRLL